MPRSIPARVSRVYIVGKKCIDDILRESCYKQVGGVIPVGLA